MTRREILSHHSLRGIAAILVVFYHFRVYTHDRSAMLDQLMPFFSNGYLWVDFFFVLSGFVLTYVYYTPLQTTRLPQFNWRKFLFARFLRIYPLHIFTLLLLLAFELLLRVVNLISEPVFDNGRRSIESFIGNLFLVHGWGIFDSHTWNLPSWSISTEAFAYLCFPLLLLVLTRNRIIGATVFLVLAALMLGFVLINNNGMINRGAPLLRCFSGFLLGMAAFSIWENTGGLSMFYANIMQSVALIGVISSMSFNCNDALSVAFLILLVISTADDKGWLPVVLKFGPLVYLGRISYSVYLLHGLFDIAYWKLGERYVFSDVASLYSHTNVSILKVTSLLMLTFITASLTYKYVEVPARNYFKRSRAISIQACQTDNAK